MNNILISINCITYNHEKYIADAIESFLMQKTFFKYEILIHDDASTDKTPEIIKSYEKKYPDIIKPIYQTENQHSKGINVTFFNLKRALGKYIAMCEGDDYWTNPSKLQKQVEILETNTNIVATFHKVEEVTPDKKKKGTYVEVPYSRDNNEYDLRDIIRFDGGKIHVSSLVYRKESFTNANVPKFFHDCKVGDLPMMLIFATKGNFLYIDDIMSCTRRGVTNGATQRLFKNAKSFIITNNSIIDTYNEFNKFTQNVYSKDIEEVLKHREFLNLKKKGDYEKIKENDYFKKGKIIEKLKLLIYCKSPTLYVKLRAIKKQLYKLNKSK